MVVDVSEKVREIMLAAYSPTVLPQGNRVIPPHVFVHVNHHLQHYSTSAFTQSPCGESGGEYCDTQRSGRRRRCIGAKERKNARRELNRLVNRRGTRRRHFSHLEHPASRCCSAPFLCTKGHTCPILVFFTSSPCRARGLPTRSSFLPF